MFNAFYSTQIPNIEVYLAVPKFISENVNSIVKIISKKSVKNFLIKLIDKFITGPNEKLREKSFSYIWGKAENEKGNFVEHLYKYPDGYTFTAKAAAKISSEVLKGNFKAGTQTPSLVFGSEFAEQFLIKKLK